MSEPTCTDYANALSAWPNCSVADCPHKACLHLGSSRCWPHTVGQPFNCHDGMTEREITEFNRMVENAWLAQPTSRRAVFGHKPQDGQHDS